MKVLRWKVANRREAWVRAAARGRGRGPRGTARDCTRGDPATAICLRCYRRYDRAQKPSRTMPTPPLPDDAGALSATPAFSPLYQHIKDLILQSLQQGEWKPGEGIPSEMVLAARYRVSQG